MNIQKVEMTVEQKENGQYVEQVAYPYVEYDHVAMENGMDIMSMIKNDVSTPMVTHNTTSWKVGQGDSDVSETIVDSSVGDMTVKGQTYQNILPNPSLRNSMINGKTMQKLNEGYDSVNTVDGVCKSAILKGQTLVNLAQPSLRAWTTNLNSDTASLKATTEEFIIDWSKGVPFNAWIQARNDNSPVFGGMLKADTDYTFIIRILENNPTFEGVTVTGNVANLQMWGLRGYHAKSFSLQAGVTGTIALKYNFNTLSTATQDNENIFGIAVQGTASNGTKTIDGGKLRISKDVIVLEGDYTNNYQYIPYFEGMQSVKMPVLTTTGKNVFNIEDFLELEKHTDFTAFGSGYNRSFVINGEPNTTYVISRETNEQFTDVPLSILNSDGLRQAFTNVAQRTRQITTTSDGKVYLSLQNVTQEKLYSLSEKVKQIQVEIGTVSTATSYEPYKSNILSCNEEVTLRGIGDVKDTLDGNTGELTQRIGEVVLDGSEDWVRQHYTTGYTMFRYIVSNLPTDTSIRIGRMLCDKFNVENYINTQAQTREFITIRSGITGQLLLNVSNEKADGVTALKEWLSQNPVTVQYQLATESIKTVDLTILDQDNQPINQLNSFANGYIQVSSQEGTLIPATEYEAPTSNSYHVNLMKPNTQYTMKNMQGTFTIDGIQYNASVNGTFTSPSALTNKFMITSVAQNQPMLLEGDMTSGEVPYVEGIKSTFEGVDKVEVYSVGKNLVSSDWEKGRINNTTGENQNSEFHIRCKGFIRVNNCETYTWSNKNTLFKTVYEYDRDKNYLGVYHTYSSKIRTFTVSEKTEYIRVWEQTTEFEETTQIEQGTQATTFEPYKSNTTSFQLPNPLRSLPNGVRDEIILDRVNHKAKFIKRVGEDLTQLDTPIITEANLEGYPYVYKGGHIFLNTEIAPITEVTYSINQAHQIESSNEDILRHQKEINHLYELIAQYVQVQYETELIDIALQG